EPEQHVIDDVPVFRMARAIAPQRLGACMDPAFEPVDRSPELSRHGVLPTVVIHGCFAQSCVPNRRPTSAVAPMATAPQNVTRNAPAPSGAPPRRAALAPSAASR